MKADVLTLSSSLNSAEVDLYTIPQYQRPYTWGKENFSVLWEDLLNAFEEAVKNKNSETPSDNYFLGPVVFVKKKNTNRSMYDIIDGQQRITTFHIILWYLYKKLTDEIEKKRVFQILTFLQEESKLKVSAKDAATFHQIRHSLDIITGNSKMAICANYFRKEVDLIVNPNEFSEFLREKTQFIVITADDYNKAWDLFIGLNGKGEPLNPTDLVKAYVCGLSNISEQIGNIWDTQILPLKDDSTQFLLFLSRFKGKKLVSENSLFREISKQFPTVINENAIIEFSSIFYLFWLKPIDEIEDEFGEEFSFSTRAKKLLKILRDLQRRDITTLLFQLAEAFGKMSIFDDEILSILTSYQIRMAISRKRSQERKIIIFFKDIKFRTEIKTENINSEENNCMIDKKNALEKIKEFIKTDIPSDEEFEKYVTLGEYGGSTTRIILRCYEEGKRGNKAFSDFELEHLMPKTGSDFWYVQAGTSDKDEYAKIVNKIGNLFVIDSITNKQIKNRDFSFKKEFYQAELKDWSISRVTSDKNNWTKIDIDNRAKEIAVWAKDYWKIPE
ncbi:MAG: DUF262 domain-containing HNH endonuclease family protein [bacterium]